MRTQTQFGSVASLVFLFAVHTGSAWAQSVEKPSKVYELRFYTANAGKLADFSNGLPQPGTAYLHEVRNRGCL
jgi:hypothetical protein